MKKVVVAFLAFFLISAFQMQAKKYSVDTEKSTLEWHGEKVTGEHNGYIKIKSGSFTIENNMLTAGKFVIDMKTITNEDLSGQWNEKLVGHLKSEDFFHVEEFPTSVLIIDKQAEINNGTAEVQGNLTIKGITEPITFTGEIKNGKYMATINVDRTKYNVRYGSNKFFDNLGDKAIDDIFTMKVVLYPEDLMAH